MDVVKFVGFGDCMDLCEMFLVIIDFVDVCDYDDVCWVEIDDDFKNPGGYIVWVVIVDVVYYVMSGLVLD